ncbi:hypothetical protein AAC387_Pa07g2615 [Persea americana]
MRVLFWKFHCPSFICFCKSPRLSLSTPRQSGFKNTQHVSSSLPSVLDDEGELSPQNIDDKKNRVDGVVEEVIPPRSSLKKPSRSGSKQIEKGNVQWVDVLGKELVEIREFEPSESEESEDDANSNRGCVCVIQ